MNKLSSIVKISSFYSEVLENERNLYIYLPPSYETDLEKTYPVLYMHDGQNIFHPASINGESWNIHKTVDRLITEGKMEEIIIVGIPNMGEERANEYSFHSFNIPSLNVPSPLAGINPKGERYEKFIINEIKPYIDSNFRTKANPENTALMGSSRGGAVTYHIGFRRPDIFGMLGILCPYFVYIDPLSLKEFPQFNRYSTKKAIKKIWIDVGQNEGLLIPINHVKNVAKQLLDVGYSYQDELVYYQDPEAAHTEKDWEKRVHAPLLYFFGKIGNPNSVQLYGRDIVGLKGVQASLNPIITYDSGFIMSEIHGNYTVENPDILEVKTDGTLIPKKTGKTTVTFHSHGLVSSKEIVVVDYIPKLSRVSLRIQVPKNTPDLPSLYADCLQLKKITNLLYGGDFLLPTDTGFILQISTSVGNVELSSDNKIVKHSFTALDNLNLEWKVEKWS